MLAKISELVRPVNLNIKFTIYRPGLCLVCVVFNLAK